ncbi:hypothetical protein CN533_29725 [Priestia megaterium]|uniref:hypothetical protein n=1 Tax=Priestia megaterium TaxID=1404 RepID=UPI000BF4A7F6|nr:hypothetical protein [Priestia megaterium]PET65599.1 hypothetical protein CN533_29725 [Priestia megaterium]PFK80775.1 hypothetical protein COJ19_28720 [Priestia megaterium]
MNTNYMPDYGLQTWAYHLSMSYPFDLDYLSPDDQRYNIYVATLIPKLNIDENSVQFFEDYIRFDVIVGTGEHTSRETLDISIISDDMPEFDHRKFEFDYEKPRKAMVFTGWEKGPIELNLLHVYLEESKYYLDTEIVYIGQAFRENGERLPAEELMSDPTLQKLEADLLREYPEKDLALLLLEFKSQLLEEIDSEDEDLIQLEEITKNPPLELNNQIIGVTEAALINYFKPEYNEKFNNDFPRVEDHGLHYRSVNVQVHPDIMGLKLYSKEKKYLSNERIVSPLLHTNS